MCRCVPPVGRAALMADRVMKERSALKSAASGVTARPRTERKALTRGGGAAILSCFSVKSEGYLFPRPPRAVLSQRQSLHIDQACLHCRKRDRKRRCHRAARPSGIAMASPWRGCRERLLYSHCGRKMFLGCGKLSGCLGHLDSSLDGIKTIQKDPRAWVWCARGGVGYGC